MFNLFKKKPSSSTTISIQEKEINPMFSNLVSQEAITKLKLELINFVIVSKPQQKLTNADKELIIKSLIAQIPLLLQTAMKEASPSVNIYYFNIHSIGSLTYKLFPADIYGKVENLFLEIVEDLVIVLNKMGIKCTQDTHKVSIATEFLIKYCNYEKVISLKE